MKTIVALRSLAASSSAMLQAPAAEMQFREPVKTVGHGANEIELRRLTPEEKDARRRRRNIVMLLTGAAILIAIAVVLGSGRRRR